MLYDTFGTTSALYEFLLTVLDIALFKDTDYYSNIFKSTKVIMFFFSFLFSDLNISQLLLAQQLDLATLFPRWAFKSLLKDTWMLGRDNNLDYISWHEMNLPFLLWRRKNDSLPGMLTLKRCGTLNLCYEIEFLYRVNEWNSSERMSFKCEGPEFEITPIVESRLIHLPFTSSSTYPFSLLSTNLSSSFFFFFAFATRPRLLILQINPFMNGTQSEKGRGIERVRDDRILRL